ncbi:uncharacterized protein LAESUDRAFT_717967 [Laetiporus sulphureus 93-53]|uniref:Uncharacterized protein n=1 Tax=Laetiporus sulphureus 93-53 TaxID=1314785 RepID=A0A165BBV8_9APHY|nr:uncharacterized protein LAESUDRAFT_717967 [Laetiporus sulphureus 93-53]KZT00699.1 hypothetical protein LAESUDRAFT_717967 [Laetiporus sulphureus 93-53]
MHKYKSSKARCDVDECCVLHFAWTLQGTSRWVVEVSWSEVLAELARRLWLRELAPGQVIGGERLEEIFPAWITTKIRKPLMEKRGGCDARASASRRRRLIYEIWEKGAKTPPIRWSSSAFVRNGQKRFGRPNCIDDWRTRRSYSAPPGAVVRSHSGSWSGGETVRVLGWDNWPGWARCAIPQRAERAQ